MPKIQAMIMDLGDCKVQNNKHDEATMKLSILKNRLTRPLSDKLTVVRMMDTTIKANDVWKIAVLWGAMITIIYLWGVCSISCERVNLVVELVDTSWLIIWLPVIICDLLSRFLFSFNSPASFVNRAVALAIGNIVFAAIASFYNPYDVFSFYLLIGLLIFTVQIVILFLWDRLMRFIMKRLLKIVPLATTVSLLK